MAYFPFFIDLKKKDCFVIGGGKVAYRKISVLLEFGANISVISKCFCEEIIELGDKLTLINSEFSSDCLDIDNIFLVVSAVDDREINSLVYRFCVKKNIFVNIADDIDKCTFIFPAIIKEKDIVVGVSTSGKSPILSKILRDNIKNNIPDYYSDLLEKLGLIRDDIKMKIHNENERKKILREVTKLGLDHKGEIAQYELDELILNMTKGGMNE